MITVHFSGLTHTPHPHLHGGEFIQFYNHCFILFYFILKSCCFSNLFSPSPDEILSVHIHVSITVRNPGLLPRQAGCPCKPTTQISHAAYVKCNFFSFFSQHRVSL